MTFDPTKPVQTRDGRPARIICTDLVSASGKSIVALAKEPFGTYAGKNVESVTYYYSDGHFLPSKIDNDMDLVNVPERVVRFVNIKTHECISRANSVCHTTTRRKDKKFDDFSTLKLTFEDGKLISSEVIR